jgi:hypothetical protein
MSKFLSRDIEPSQKRPLAHLTPFHKIAVRMHPHSLQIDDVHSPSAALSDEFACELPGLIECVNIFGEMKLIPDLLVSHLEYRWPLVHCRRRAQLLLHRSSVKKKTPPERAKSQGPEVEATGPEGAPRRASHQQGYSLSAPCTISISEWRLLKRKSTAIPGPGASEKITGETRVLADTTTGSCIRSIGVGPVARQALQRASKSTPRPL